MPSDEENSKYFGGKDSYQNLTIIHLKIHLLIHEEDNKRASVFIKKLKFTLTQLEIINRFQKKLTFVNYH